MKYLACLLLCALFSGCVTSQNLVQPSAYFATAKLLENSNAGKRPERVAALRGASAALTELANTGKVSRETVNQALARFLSNDTELNTLRMLLVSYFPDGGIPAESMVSLARNLALGINAALPAEVSK